MNPLTVEWIDKAEGDFTTALRAGRFHSRILAELKF